MLQNKHNFDIFKKQKLDPQNAEFERIMKNGRNDSNSLDDILFGTVSKERLADNQLRLLNGKIITLNDEQFDGVPKIKAWLKGDKTFFVLAGYSGSGKSTLIKKILDEYRGGVVVSAPTHSAKKVIMRMTGKKGITLSGLLGLRPDLSYELFDPNNPIFAPIAMPKIADYNLIIIDEASQINKALYNLILEKTKGTTTKVLFVGDPAQIPPIGENMSIVFTQTMFEVHWLRKIERQKDTNPLILIYSDLRNNIDKVDGGIRRKTILNNKGEGVIFTTNKREFRKLMIEKFKSSEYENDTDFVKIIAWKNDTVDKSNIIVREALIGKNMDIVEENDVLTGYKTVTSQNMRFNIIENSADYRVMKKWQSEINSYGIEGYRIKLREDLTHDEIKYQDIFVVNTNNFENLHLFAEMQDFFYDMSKSNKKFWPKYYEFRRNNFLMIDIDKYKNGQYREKGKVITKDLSYGYAISAHKAQGSTHSYSFVLEEDIKANWILEDRNRIFYVALSRPQISAIVLTTKLDF